MFTTVSLPLLTTLLLAGVTSVRAHGHVVSWNVNGQDRPGFNPSYPPEYGRTASRPTDNADQGWANQYTEQVACGGYGNGENLDTWDVQEGSTITATWNQWPEGHHGPVTEYMARCPDSGCNGVAAAKLGWFKISEYGWDGNQWGSDRIHQTNRWSFNVPTGLAPGYYLFRHEITAMHTVGEPQVYPVCFQARLASSGSIVPSDTVTFPEALNQHDDFRRFNLYYGDDFNAFHIAGPDVWNGSGGSAPAPAPASSSVSSPSASTPADAPASDVPAPSEAPSSSGDGGYKGGYGGGEGAPSAQESPSRSLVTSNAMATGKKYCRRRQPASAEGLVARKVSEGKRQHVVNRYAKRSLHAH